MELLLMIWSTEPLEFNLIENLWRIIKRQMSSCRHQIHKVEEMKVAINEELEKLIEKYYEKCIEGMQKRYKLVIQAKSGFIKY